MKSIDSQKKESQKRTFIKGLSGGDRNKETEKEEPERRKQKKTEMKSQKGRDIKEETEKDRKKETERK